MKHLKITQNYPIEKITDLTFMTHFLETSESILQVLLFWTIIYKGLVQGTAKSSPWAPCLEASASSGMGHPWRRPSASEISCRRPVLLTCAADGNHSAKDLGCIKYYTIIKNRRAQISDTTYEMVQDFNEFSPLTVCDVRGLLKRCILEILMNI